MGFVYIANCGPYYKIGYSDNPVERMRAFQTGNPYPLNLVGCIAGEPDDEKHFHRLYSEKKVQGEWFDLDAQDIARILSSIQDKPIAKASGKPATVRPWGPPDLRKFSAREQAQLLDFLKKLKAESESHKFT